MSRIRASQLKHAFPCALLLSLVVVLVTGIPPAGAYSSLSDGGIHRPPTSGGYAYYNTYGTFGPNNPGFPGVGESFVDPMFGNTITRLTNEVGFHAINDIYAKNGFMNADNTLVVHAGPGPLGRRMLNTRTGAVVRSNLPGNDNGSFDPNDPDVYWWYTFGGTTLHRYRVSTGTSTVVKTFGQPIGNNGGSVDWIDNSGRYMLLRLGSSWRIYDVLADFLYAGAIPDIYGGGQGWAGISPDASWVITTDPPHRAFAINHGTRTVDTTGHIFWTLCGDHGDLVTASDGKTYMVTFECDSESAVYVVDVSLVQSPDNKPQQRAQNRRLFYIAWSEHGHFSGVSRGPLRDWAFISVESGGDTFGSTVDIWRPYEQEIVMANVLTGEVRRLAHHRSRSPFANYYYTPRVSASWDGTLVTWASNFGNNGNGYSDIYAMHTEGGPPPPLTVTLTSPEGGAQVSGTTPVSVSASGGSGNGYYYWIYAGDTPIYVGPSPTCDWDTTAFPDGPITLTVWVTDDASGSASATRNVTVANKGTPLTIVFTAPESGATVSGTVTVSYAASGGNGKDYTYTVRAGTDVIYEGPSPSFSWDTTTWPDGPVTLTVTVTDDAKGTAQATRDVTVSNEGGGGGSQNVVWVNTVRVAVNGNTITKNAGCHGCWDAGASSQQRITAGNGYIEFRTSSGALLAAGLSNNDTSTSANEIKWSLRFFNNYAEVRESGVYRADWPIAAGDVHRVAVEGGRVKYYRNGTLKYTSTQTPTYPLLLDSTIEGVGHSIQNAIINR